MRQELFQEWRPGCLLVVMVKLGGDRGLVYEMFCKLTVSVINMVANYVFSKLWIFKKEIGTAVGKVNAVSREEIEQVEKELDAVLEMVQRPVTVKM